MFVASLCRNIPVPYTVLLVILGLVINFSEALLPSEFTISQFQLTNELVLFVFYRLWFLSPHYVWMPEAY